VESERGLCGLQLNSSISVVCNPRASENCKLRKYCFGGSVVALQRIVFAHEECKFPEPFVLSVGLDERTLTLQHEASLIQYKVGWLSFIGQMEISPTQLEELRQRILATFPKTDPPLPENITSHPCEECAGVTEDFRGVRWWAANNTLIDENFDDMPLFTPEAYHYYLPTFLLRALDTFDPDNMVAQFCVYNLSPEKTADDTWYRLRLDQFTPDEVSVIGTFLEYIRADERFAEYHDDAEAAIRDFWH
jgi:hypothetical protein